MGNESFFSLGPGARTALHGRGVATQNCLAKVDWPGSAFEGGLYKRGATHLNNSS